MAKKKVAKVRKVDGSDLPERIYVAWSGTTDDRELEVYGDLDGAEEANSPEFCVGEYRLVRRGTVSRGATAFTPID